MRRAPLRQRGVNGKEDASIVAPELGAGADSEDGSLRGALRAVLAIV